MRSILFASLIAASAALPGAGAPPVVLELRMLTPLTTIRAKEGSPIRAELTRPLTRQDDVLMPVRSTVHGQVRRVSPVGLGVRRERASLEITFTHWRDPDGEMHPIETTLLHIDNAREQVDTTGRIRGILAASNPLSIVRGVWFRPSRQLLFRAPAGLTGPAGTAWTRLALGPIGAVSLLGARFLFTRMPEPEIALPAGTELTLRLHTRAPERTWGQTATDTPISGDLAGFLRGQPAPVTKPGGGNAGDVINVALAGTREQTRRAFAAAGWSEADPLNKETFWRCYHAFTRRQGYPTAPVSKLLYLGRAPDLVFQKSLNSMAKRHHIRLWRTEGPNGEELWLGAATHDVTVTFDRKNFSLTHRIDANLDKERAKVLADLEFAGALASAGAVARELVLEDGLRSDGALAVAFLQEPDSALEHTGTHTARVPRLCRIVRRVALETRHYLWRENMYYLSYLTGRSLFSRRKAKL